MEAALLGCEVNHLLRGRRVMWSSWARRFTFRPETGAHQRSAAVGTTSEHADIAERALRSELPLIEAAPTLRDKRANDELRLEGYVVIDLLDGDGVAELRALRRAFHNTPRTGWFSDFYSPDPVVKRTVNDRMKKAFRPAVERLFIDHESVLQNFVINWPGNGGGLVLHQHSSVVDTKHRSVVVWCAVSDASEENGTLHVVPRSHRLQGGPRPERTASWHEPHENLILRNHLVSVPLRAGQAIVFDNQLLHCSFENLTDEPRVSAALVVIPSLAGFRYFEATSSASVRVYRVDHNFFIDNEAGELEWAEPAGLEFVEELEWAPTTVTASEVERLLPRGTCSHSR